MGVTKHMNIFLQFHVKHMRAFEWIQVLINSYYLTGIIASGI